MVGKILLIGWSQTRKVVRCLALFLEAIKKITVTSKLTYSIKQLVPDKRCPSVPPPSSLFSAQQPLCICRRFVRAEKYTAVSPSPSAGKKAKLLEEVIGTTNPWYAYTGQSHARKSPEITFSMGMPLQAEFYEVNPTIKHMR